MTYCEEKNIKIKIARIIQNIGVILCIISVLINIIILPIIGIIFIFGIYLYVVGENIENCYWIKLKKLISFLNWFKRFNHKKGE